MSEIYKELARIQKELKAPKSQVNAHMGYSYRSCEDILSAVKSLIPDGYALLLTDEIAVAGNRHYVKSTSIFTDGENEIRVTAYAREPEFKKGLDEAQVTGATSSYSRKYSLNGLFCIDDEKDADTMDNRESGSPPAQQRPKQTQKSDGLYHKAGCIEVLKPELAKVTKEDQLQSISERWANSEPNLSKKQYDYGRDLIAAKHEDLMAAALSAPIGQKSEVSGVKSDDDIPF